MRVFASSSLMAVLFLSGCAFAPRQESAQVAMRSIAAAKVKLASVKSFASAKLEPIIVETEKSLDSAACAVQELAKTEANDRLEAKKLKESTEFWQKKHLQAVGKLNFWRFLFFGILAINFSVALAAYSVRRFNPLRMI